MIDFDGQVAVVTGAGRGLGRLYALELARRGASVVVNDLGGIHARRRRRRQRRGPGRRGDPAAGGGRGVARLRRQSRGRRRRSSTPPSSQFGRLDAVVSNAGIFNSIAVRRTDARRLAAHAARAPRRRLLPGQPAYRVMKTQGYGRFVFIASSAGMFGQHLEAHYAAAKAGLVGLTNVIAIEGAPHGILANTVLPFGFSRMVTETSATPKALEEIGVPAGDPARNWSCRWSCTWPAGRASSATTTTRPSAAASPACSSASAKDGWRTRQSTRPPTTSRPTSPRSRRRAVHGPRVDLRGGLRGLRAARRRPHVRRVTPRRTGRPDAS